MSKEMNNLEIIATVNGYIVTPPRTPNCAFDIPSEWYSFESFESLVEFLYVILPYRNKGEELND